MDFICVLSKACSYASTSDRCCGLDAMYGVYYGRCTNSWLDVQLLIVPVDAHRVLLSSVALKVRLDLGPLFYRLIQLEDAGVDARLFVLGHCLWKHEPDAVKALYIICSQPMSTTDINALLVASDMSRNGTYLVQDQIGICELAGVQPGTVATGLGL